MNLKVNRKIYYRMLGSCILMILLFILTVVIIALTLFRQEIYSEIGKYNERILQNTTEQIVSNVLNPSQAVFLDIFLPQNNFPILYESSDSSWLDKLNLYNELKNVAAKHSNTIDRIHIYFHDDNTMVSSNYGYKEFSTRDFKGHYGWLENIPLRGEICYHAEKSLSGDSSIQYYITLAYNYPFDISAGKIRYSVFVTVNEAKIRAILSDAFSSGYNHPLLVTSDGTIISSLERSLIFTFTDTFVLKQIDTKTDYGLRNFHMDGGDYIFSYHSVPGTEWYLVNTISIRDFYHSYFMIRFYLIAICILIVFIAIHISAIFSRYFYNPIQQLSSKAAKSYGVELRGKNEFNIIEGALDTMHLQIDNLQQILKANGPIIKQNFLMSLLDGSLTRTEDIVDRLHLLNLPSDFSFAVCFLIDFGKNGLDSIPLEKSQVIKLEILQQLNVEGEAWFTLAGELGKSRAVGTLVYDSGGLQVGLDSIVSTCGEFLLTPVVGDAVTSIFSLKESLQQAEITQQYLFLYPNVPILSYSDIVTQHEGSKTLPVKELAELQFLLDTEDPVLFKLKAGFVINELKTGGYGIDYVKSTIFSLMEALYSKSICSIDKSQNLLKEKMNEAFLRMNSIDYLKDCINDYIKFWEQEQSYIDTIAQVKEYIEDNLSTDLSLESISSQVYFSPKYLSRVFKESTGCNLSDYITDRRMKKACRLLKKTQLSVKDIAVEVGYNSSAYFIKRFRETYGCTPLQYQRQH